MECMFKRLLVEKPIKKPKKLKEKDIFFKKCPKNKGAECKCKIKKIKKVLKKK